MHGVARQIKEAANGKETNRKRVRKLWTMGDALAKVGNAHTTAGLAMQDCSV